MILTGQIKVKVRVTFNSVDYKNTMIASRPAVKEIMSVDFENVCHGHNLQQQQNYISVISI